MTGIAIHNIGILRKKFEFVANPMYSFGRDALAGAFQADYFIMPTNAFFNNITITASTEQFATRNTATTQRLTGGLRMNFINPKRANKKDIYIEFKHIFVRQDFYILSPGEAHKIGEEDYNLLRFRKADNRLMNPYSLDLEVQHGMRFAKASVTAEYKLSYHNPKKGLRVRFFAGTFLWKSNLLLTSGQDVRFRLSGQTGSQDYLFNDIFLGRNETTGLLSHQMSMTDGGFKVFSFRGQTYDYLTTLNLSSNIPGKLPFRVYLDLGHYFNGETDADPLAYSGGLSLHLIDGIFEIYAPCFNSEAIKKTLELQNARFVDQIRFVLNIPLANPISLIRKLNF